jgi:hypothetical protein
LKSIFTISRFSERNGRTSNGPAFHRYLKTLAVLFVLSSALLIPAFIGAHGSFDWAELQPAIAGSGSVEDLKDCLECHEDYMAAFDRTVHARAFEYGAAGAEAANACELCHGPIIAQARRPSHPARARFRLPPVPREGPAHVVARERA